MRTLTPAQRRAFRASAHHLHPVVSIGQHGLTPRVLHEIDVSLLAHELIKIRVFSDARDERDAMLARICAELDAAAVQHLGKLLIVWRPAPVPEETEPPAKSPRKSTARSPDRRKPAVGVARAVAAKRPPRGVAPKPAPRRRPRNGDASDAPKPSFGKAPRGVTAAMMDGDAHRRPRESAATGKRGKTGSGPRTSGPRDRGLGARAPQARTPRGAGTGKGAPHSTPGKGAAAGTRRRRTPR